MELSDSNALSTNPNDFKPSETVINNASSPSSTPVHILAVGSNAISAFFSWRLQSSNACKVTLVWRNHFDAVSSYGISFRSNTYGSERFKPHKVVQTIEKAKDPHCPFDYIFVCIKALPDIYDIATIIEPVVTSSHTCIIINTTNSIGIENNLIERFPKNLVLSLVSEATFTQLNVADYEHFGSKDVWIGLIEPNLILPEETQRDMIESLTLTLEAGNVNCRSSPNILQQQWEKMIGPIAFHPVSVLFDEPNHLVLLENPNIKKLIFSLFDELLRIAEAQNCVFDHNFKSKIINIMTADTSHSIMFQDYTARRPMEVHVFLTNPLEIANKCNIDVPRLETIHALMHNLNNYNHSHRSPSASVAFSRQLSPKPIINKEHRKHQLVHDPNGYNVTLGNHHNRKQHSPKRLIKHDSLEGLEEFADIAMYGDMIHVSNADDTGPMDHQDHVYANHIDEAHDHIQGRRNASLSYDSIMKEKELALYKREKMLREKEALEHKRNMARYPRKHTSDEYSMRSYGYDDDEDYSDYPVSSSVPSSAPPINSDNFDMMSMTFRRHRKNATKVPTSTMRNTFDKNEMHSDYRSSTWRQRSHSRSQPCNSVDSSLIGTCDFMQNNLMLGYSSNRYGTVDSKTLVNSRANSLTTARAEEMRDSNMYKPHHSLRSTMQYATVNGGPPARNAPYNHTYPSMMGSGNVPGNVPLRALSTSLTPLQYMPSRNMVMHHYPSHGSSKNSSNINSHRSLTGSASASITSNGNRYASGSGSGHSSTSSFERGGII